MINKDLITKKMNEINETLVSLELYKNLSVEEFLKNKELVDATKYNNRSMYKYL